MMPHSSLYIMFCVLPSHLMTPSSSNHAKQSPHRSCYEIIQQSFKSENMSYIFVCSVLNHFKTELPMLILWQGSPKHIHIVFQPHHAWVSDNHAPDFTDIVLPLRLAKFQQIRQFRRLAKHLGTPQHVVQNFVHRQDFFTIICEINNNRLLSTRLYKDWS